MSMMSSYSCEPGALVREDVISVQRDALCAALILNVHSLSYKNSSTYIRTQDGFLNSKDAFYGP